MTPELMNILINHPFFTCLDQKAIEEMCSDIISVPDKELIFIHGNPALDLFFILSGTVELLSERPQCHVDEVIATLSSHHIIGADALNRNSHYALSARTCGPVQLVRIHGPDLLHYLDQDFNTTLSLLGQMAVSLRYQVRQITELKLQSTTERLASYLIDLSDRFEGPVILRLPWEKRTLADHLGMEPATLSRAFGKLRNYGVDASQGLVVEIDDIAVLRDLCEDCDMTPEGAAP